MLGLFLLWSCSHMTAGEANQTPKDIEWHQIKSNLHVFTGRLYYSCLYSVVLQYSYFITDRSRSSRLFSHLCDVFSALQKIDGQQSWSSMLAYKLQNVSGCSRTSWYFYHTVCDVLCTETYYIFFILMWVFAHNMLSAPALIYQSWAWQLQCPIMGFAVWRWAGLIWHGTFGRWTQQWQQRKNWQIHECVN